MRRAVERQHFQIRAWSRRASKRRPYEGIPVGLALDASRPGPKQDGRSPPVPARRPQARRRFRIRARLQNAPERTIVSPIRAALLLLLLGTVACGDNGASPFPPTEAKTAEDYWFDKAELTRYETRQSRYGEIRDGESVLVFVTEPFLADEQVKHESGPGESAVPVLKLNRIRSFPTGVYDYRLMASVFHPVEPGGPDPAGLKIAMSSIEWCGLVFQQVNRRDGTLKTQLRSYFQREGDQNVSLPGVWTEDELWVRLRLDPESLPVGPIEILPELFFQRLAHLQPEPLEARARLDLESDPATYRLDYPALERRLEIRFEPSYPHRILGWTETGDGNLFC